MPFTKAELAQVASIVKLGVALKQLPDFLFKYRPLNDFFDSLLETSQMWFSSPKEFNDPFDCKAKIDSKNSADEIKSYAEKNFRFTSRLQKRQTIANWTKNPSAFHKLQQSITTSLIDETGVCCFTGDPANLLMWSHYALSHTGVCLKFEILKDPEFFSTPLKVIYSDEYPVYNHLRDGSVLVDKLLKTKSTCWSYEQELRVVKHLTKGLQRFEKEALVEIIFGCRVEKKEIERIKNRRWSKPW